MCDDVTASIVRRARWAREHNGGHPSAAWSTREQLAVALVLSDRQHLDGLGYTVAEAARTIHDGMADPPGDFAAWITDIRAAVTAPLSDGAADARIEVVRIVGEIKNLIDRAQDALRHAENDTGDTTGQRDTGGTHSRHLSIAETPDLS